MTLVELQNKLGEQIELLTDEKTPYEAKKRDLLMSAPLSLVLPNK